MGDCGEKSMSLTCWILLGVGILLIGGAVFSWFYTMHIAKGVYNELLVRTTPEKWGRVNSCPTDAEYSEMYNTAVFWQQAHSEKIREVSIVSDGFRLAGEFLDQGSDHTAILISGRAEGLDYSYYFAPPYYEAGFNLLSIDIRCHGKSEGKYNGLGIKEYVDLQNWARFLETECHTKFVLLHAICIGSASSVLACTKPGCPDVIRALVVEGMYTNWDLVLNHRFQTGNRPIFPVKMQLEMLIKKHSGVDIKKESPENYIGKLKLPILFLHGKQDVSSPPYMANELFAACGSEKKQLVWLEKGAHSHLRICNPAEYDGAIAAFLQGLN